MGWFEIGRDAGIAVQRSKKGPPFGEHFLILRMGHQESNTLITT